MNIYTQICGLIIILLILIFSVKQRNLNLKSDKLYRIILFVDLFVILLDITSVVTIYFKDYIWLFLVEFIAKLYLVSLITVTYLCFLYVAVDIIKDYKKFKLTLSHTIVATAIVSIAVIFLPIEVVKIDNQIYSKGLACYATYFMTIFTIIITFIFSMSHLSKVNIVKRNTILIWLSIWIVSAAIQFVFKEILIVAFASSVGILIIYFRLERNDLKFNIITNLFTIDALKIYIEDRKTNNKDYQVFYLTYYYINQDTFNIISKDFYQYLSKLGADVLPFSIDEKSVVLVFNNNMNKDILLGNLIARIHEGFGPVDSNIHVTPKIFYMKSLSAFKEHGVSTVISYINNINYDMNEYLYYNLGTNINNEIEHIQKIERYIVKSIQEDRVVAYYQPIYSKNDKKFDGAEALIRIKDDDGNIIYPEDFIPIAEKNGMITSLDYAIFEKTCKFISENDMEKLGLEFIDVNVSVIQAIDDHMAQKYISLIEKYHINPKYIKLEITESAVITNRQSLINNMLELVDYGIKFALDDYGVGNSNISYLASLPIKYVKIDKTFTKLFFTDQKANYIVKNEINMFKGLNLYVVFEGVEEKEQLDGILKLDVDYVQGFYYSKPLVEKEFLKFIERYNSIEE